MCKTWTLRYACGHRIYFRLSTCHGKKTAISVSNYRSCERRKDQKARSSEFVSTTRVLCSGTSSLRLRMQIACGPCCRAALEREAADMIAASEDNGPLEVGDSHCPVLPAVDPYSQDSADDELREDLPNAGTETNSGLGDNDDDLARRIWELEQQYPGATYKVLPQPGQARLASTVGGLQPRLLVAPPAHLVMLSHPGRELELTCTYTPSLLSCEVQPEDIVLPVESPWSWESGEDTWQPVDSSGTEWPKWGWESSEDSGWDEWPSEAETGSSTIEGSGDLQSEDVVTGTDGGDERPADCVIDRREDHPADETFEPTCDTTSSPDQSDIACRYEYEDTVVTDMGRGEDEDSLLVVNIGEWDSENRRKPISPTTMTTTTVTSLAAGDLTLMEGREVSSHRCRRGRYPAATMCGRTMRARSEQPAMGRVVMT